MLSITVLDRINFEEKTVNSFRKGCVTQSDQIMLTKVLAKALDKLQPNNNLQYSKLNEELFLNPKQLNDTLENLLKYYMNIATKEEVELVYTSTDLAKYFGVSVQTINTWVNEGRFVGFQREPGKQIRMSENTFWISRQGNKVQVREFVENWEKEYGDQSVTNENTAHYDQLKIKDFETRYGGSFKEVFGKEQSKTFTAEKQSDAELWKYLINKGTMNVD